MAKQKSGEPEASEGVPGASEGVPGASQGVPGASRAPKAPDTAATVQHPTTYVVGSLQDEEDEYYRSLYAGQHGTTVPGGLQYEFGRSQRQLGHWYDTSKYPASAPTLAKAAVSKKVSKQDLERFRRRKEEKKRLKNKWLYE